MKANKPKYTILKSPSPWQDSFKVDDGHYEGLLFYFTQCIVTEVEGYEELALDYSFTVLRRPTKFADMFDAEDKNTKDLVTSILEDIIGSQLIDLREEYVQQNKSGDATKTWVGFLYQYKEKIK